MAVDICEDEKDNYYKVWNCKRTSILNKYTTGEKLTIISSFLPGGEKSMFLSIFVQYFKIQCPMMPFSNIFFILFLVLLCSVSTFSALIRQVSNLNEKVKHRLEQLDDFDESSVRKTIGLSQQEFVTKVHMLDEEIKKVRCRVLITFFINYTYNFSN